MEKQMERFFEMALRRLYSAEAQTYDQLLVSAKEATSQALKDLFNRHTRETLNQIDRLKNIFQTMGFDPTATKMGEAQGALEKGKELLKSLATMEFVGKSLAMEGVIDEANELLSFFTGTPLLDCVLAMGAGQIEMAEIGFYQALSMLAEESGLEGVADLLEVSLGEERQMHEDLMELAQSEVQKA